MKLTKAGLYIDIDKDASPDAAAKVTQWLANSINGPVVAHCSFGDVLVDTSSTINADAFIRARQYPDERDKAPNAVENAAPGTDMAESEDGTKRSDIPPDDGATKHNLTGRDAGPGDRYIVDNLTSGLPNEGAKDDPRNKTASQSNDPKPPVSGMPGDHLNVPASLKPKPSDPKPTTPVRK